MTDTTTTAEHASGDHHDEHLAHPVSYRTLFLTLAALLFLTVVTVAVTYVDLGGANIYIALGIAVVKATIVGLFFMHLRWDKPFNGFVILGSVFFTALFIAFVVKDVAEYKAELDPMGAVEKSAREEARTRVETEAAEAAHSGGSHDDEH